ncbi:hypothetical protein [Serratia proteamaculans]|uniref:hypothetical protein n=1 Tax=Serratia proteamaculans TaxID=28151 RepID=UPI003CFC91BC
MNIPPLATLALTVFVIFGAITFVFFRKAAKRNDRPFWYLVIGICGLFSYMVLAIYLSPEKRENEQAQFKAFDYRTFDRPIIADAPGCEIRSPKGELLNQVVKGSPAGKVTYQKGTTFTIDCFPIQASEKTVLRE